MHILVVEHDAQLVQASLIRPEWVSGLIAETPSRLGK